MNAAVMSRPHWIQTALLLFALLVLTLGMNAQCVMCKAVAEDSAAAGSIGEGLNNGIMYIMLIPYILLASIGWFVWKRRRELA